MLDRIQPVDLILLVGILGGILLVAFIALKTFRFVSGPSKLESELASFGFDLATIDEAELLRKRLDRLRAGGIDEVHTHARDIYARRDTDRIVYAYPGAGSGDKVAGGFAVVSSRLVLPRFTLFPNFQQEGMLAAFANQTMEKLLSRIMRPVEITGSQRFVEVYDVYGEQPDQVLQFLNTNRMHGLASEVKGYLEAADDMFLFMPFPARLEPAPGVQVTLSTVDSLFRLFVDVES